MAVKLLLGVHLCRYTAEVPAGGKLKSADIQLNVPLAGSCFAKLSQNQKEYFWNARRSITGWWNPARTPELQQSMVHFVKDYFLRPIS